MTIAVYTRVSNEIQVTEGTSLDAQKELCLNKIKENISRHQREIIF